MPRVRNSCHPFDNLDVMRTVYCTKNNNAKSEERVEYDGRYEIPPGYELIACAAYPLIRAKERSFPAHLLMLMRIYLWWCCTR